MRYKILFSILLFANSVKSQDVSFSQFDLNMLYMNPALAGYEQNFRVLTISRNQWVGIIDNYNSNLIELNLSSNLKKRRISGGEINWTGGFYLLQNKVNTIFKSYEVGVVPWTFHFQLPKRMYLSLSLQNTLHFNSIDWNQLIFSDQINDYNSNVQSSSISRPSLLNQNSYLDPSFGVLLTKHSTLNRKSNNTSFIGFAWHHIYPPFQSFYNNQSEETRIPQKYTLHGQYIGAFNDMISESFNFWKFSYRHSKQGSNAIQKDDIGLTLSFANSIQLEAGAFYRIARQTSNEQKVTILMNESITPMIRLRTGIGNNMGIELSYSYDYNISKLNNINSIATHEISLNLKWQIKKVMNKSILLNSG